jgi:hypothetical protein
MTAGRSFLVPQHRDGRLGLQRAKLRLPTLLEQLGNCLAGRSLELPVEVDEPAPEPFCHLRAERRLARAHEADERDVTV